MNWDYTGTKSYVDVIPPSPFFHPNSIHERPSYWAAPQADARLKPVVLRQPCSSEQLRPDVAPYGIHQTFGPGQVCPGSVLPSHRVPLLRTSSLPPVEASKRLASTPDIPQRTFSPASSNNTPTVSQQAFSPPNSAPIPSRPFDPTPGELNMAESNRNLGLQRSLMGPPETPSRVMQASPNMFPHLQFSPDLYSTQSLGPATAPIYPQQRLFWDQPGSNPEQAPGQFHDPYQDSFDASFHSSSTIVPNFSPVVSQGSPFDLPQQTPSSRPFLDTTVFPMPFQTSPRVAPLPVENPTQFLSSPARRFGGSDVPISASYRPTRDVPAYHHQIEESRREKELERRRSRNAAKRADADLIMTSVKRALSPSKSLRPGLKRSVTHSGATASQHLRPDHKGNFNDSTSTSSVASGGSSRNGRSSPLKSRRQISGPVLSRARSSQRLRTAVSLAIDEHGVAKTIVEQVSDSENDMDLDDASQSVISSADEEDFNMIRSQSNSFAFDDTSEVSASSAGRHIDPRLGNKLSRMQQDSRGSLALSNARKRGISQTDANNSMRAGKGDAQRALRAIIEDRSRSVSAQTGYSSSRQSDSSVQFHSSPPIQQNQFNEFNASPTTITDPELATPSTDLESYASLGATRCICNSMSPDGGAMVQCDSCSKWLHAHCIGIDKRHLSDAYICVYCKQTPVRHAANRGSGRSSMRGPGNSASPLAHKSVRQNRGR